jgi:hypothetical protein
MALVGSEVEVTKPIVLLDVGSKKKKLIKRLRRGEGKLMRDVSQTIAELKTENEIEPAAQVVVVVVKQKRKSRGLFG